jgi:WD40 repeat protein
VIVMLSLTAGVGGRDAVTAVSLPDRLAGYSYLTGSVSDAPPGRALALYQHGFGVEFMDFPQAVVLAADDDVYRRLDAAEDRSGSESQGDPGPMRLSPDGRWVVLGDHNTSEATLELVDLSTGEVVRHELPEARSVLPVAWSADGSRIAYVSGDQPTNPYGPRWSRIGDLFMLDLESGEAEPVPGGDGAWTAAFSPDGRQIAVAPSGRVEGIAIVDLPSSTVRSLSHGGALAGPDAWSPDGRLLAVAQKSSIGFLDVAGSRPSTRFHLDVDQALVGWVGEREVVLLDSSDDNVTRLVAHPLEGGESREVTRVEGTSSYGVSRFQLASALLADIENRVAGEPNRGPMPAPFRIAAAVLVGVAVTILTARITRNVHVAPS